ncbi:isochorismatase domain-containing protein 1 [Cryptotermes secundus]|uniref:isochorismatase domain-containing protein 1 n=1 Tax=Cryptotermes secundus TaxID=105785 RepID=UPI000CD7B1FA|nr:isochorismatase domain-containing protein 1 [Cryptotermes secundus]
MSRSLIKYGQLAEKRTAFFLCDIQEKFRPALSHFEQILEAAKKLVQASRILNVPLVVTEQNPKGLGKTVAELDISHARGVYPKTKFSMIVPEVATELGTLCDGKLECVVLFGIEAHVCVEQTAAELCYRGLQVHVVADACTSRSQEDRLLAFERLRQIGCFVTTSEAVIFQLLGDKEHPNFADIRPLIKTVSPYTGLAAYTSKI